MEGYWNDRFNKEGMIWGEVPSKTVYHAIQIFKDNNVKSVLVPGSGYGRNTKALSAHFQVEGIEMSHTGISLALNWDPKSNFFLGSVLDHISGNKKYDAVYCFDLLHLFLERERHKLINNCIRQLNSAGLMYFTCFSNEDKNNGVGRKIEDGSYEYIEGKFAHFFTEEDLMNHFDGLQVIEIGTVVEILQYNDNQRKEYILRYIIVRKLDR
ncbi:class I SAM-dependent methyltransferase [Paenibacillus sp. WQ 127069]|uniref:Class I SAM-dependent methyltransferase n=1 Tax=Paenibacillus baimaensis TaxID=2982185 RepID=A0ABT2UF84_9BACL|nr:class I SAM-dependent methyltransferase [Paenibacillus sp. WQ 127069]MCU6793310.1 class I SAM-dependent methyltransferase [Paenibacillus sp. WQ 127069]